MLINPLNDWNFLVVFSEKDFDESVLLSTPNHSVYAIQTFNRDRRIKRGALVL